MPIYHDRDALIAVAKGLSEKSFTDGVLVDIPKARRREQAKNPQRSLTLKLDGDLKVRMATQINRYVEIFGKAIGWDKMITLLEKPTDSELQEDETLGNA